MTYFVRPITELYALAQNAITVNTSAYGGFEQVGSLPQRFSRNDVQMTTQPGDIVLYSGNQLVIFFGSNSWSYTRLGHIEGLSTDEKCVKKLKDQTIEATRTATALKKLVGAVRYRFLVRLLHTNTEVSCGSHECQLFFLLLHLYYL